MIGEIAPNLYNPAMNRILIIKLGALGDFIQAFPCFQAIRTAFLKAEISLLTTAPFASLGQAAPWFDNVMIDARPRWTDLRGLAHLRTQLRGFDLVIDLQTSGRSTRYHALAGSPRWSGLVRDDPFFHANPWRDEMHTLARQADQLRYAGIPACDSADISWLTSTPLQARAASPYIIIVPGAARHRPEKRWPIEKYAALACALKQQGLQILIIGTATEKPLAREILRHCPAARDMTGETRLTELATLMKGARHVVGNDTGPMHLAAMAGTPATVLFSSDSNPALTAPVGRRFGQVTVLRAADISAIPVETILASCGKTL
ncbi:Lipid IV(A) 3-deoxy-D-manno-octulosonic acid transferase [Acetobacteraceae bacterium EV16G]|uniref:Lipid IV(A) 3-deoxy-D-manno-octulosonic acid transferase n=2 Tax=Sorlinia euscelidii TaxID=3081148 RepID=A0ABU7TZI4_9PROT